MALARTNLTSGFTAASGTLTTSSFTPPSSSLLVAVVSFLNNGTGGSNTVSGGGWTWTKRLTVGPTYLGGSAPNYFLTSEVWTAPVSTAASMTVAAALAGTPSDQHITAQVVAYTGYDVASPIGASITRTNSADTGAVSITLSAAPASTSEVLAGRQRADNNFYNTTATPGSGWTELYDFNAGGGYQDVETQVRAGSTSTTVAWTDIDDTAGPASFAVHTFALEIKEAGGATGPVAKLYKTTQAIKRASNW